MFDCFTIPSLCICLTLKEQQQKKQKVPFFGGGGQFLNSSLYVGLKQMCKTQITKKWPIFTDLKNSNISRLNRMAN